MTTRLREATLLLVALAAALSLTPAVAPGQSHDAAAVEFFEQQVRPILARSCYNCHSAETKPAGDLRVDDRNGLLTGGTRGPAIVPGDPDASLLIAAVTQTDDDLKMPAEGDALTDAEIAALREWIAGGAAWPSVEVPDELLAPRPDYPRARDEHWAFRPMARPAAPQVLREEWPRSAVDRFVLARLEWQRLSPVGDADRVTLLRRVTFDLTGLPPTPAETAAFLADASPEAFARVVDRLLDSPAYGEHWGRHWLDVARYGESTGSARNIPFPHSWRYRDYVIDAFNADKPYDEFLREQIAGDLLPWSNDAERREHLIATGFLALGVKDVNQRFKVRFVMDNIDEQIDTVTRAVLALTVSCARCHDHKFDPISQHDYYALAGIFKSTDLCAGVRNKMGGGGLDYYDTSMLLLLSPPAPPDPAHAEKLAAAEQAVADARAEFERLRDSPEGSEKASNGQAKRQQARQKLRRLEAELTALADPAATSEVALGVREGSHIGDTEIRIRGEAERLGPPVPRGFPRVLSFKGQPSIPADQSGRLQLAEWLTSPENPLAARVIVNRAWHYLFGSGLVSTVDNFGITGDVPSHPELLDHLATKFVDEGWSIKRLVRSLVLTRTYQLSSEATPQHLAADPENRLLWRHAPRRLAAEELRDAMLAASGRLDPARPAVSPVSELPFVEIRNDGKEAQRLADWERSSRFRSVYLPMLRTLVPGSLEVFDFAEQGMVTGGRDTTTVPPQALYLLNAPFVREQSQRLAERLLTDAATDPTARISAAYRTVLSRDATAQETERTLAFIAEYAQAAGATGSTPPLDSVPVEIAAATGETTEASAATVSPGDVKVERSAPGDAAAQPIDPYAAAWASFVQALFASGEFRYVR